MAKKRPPPCGITIGSLEKWLAAAKRGDLQHIFMVGLCADGSYTDMWAADDLEDLLLEVRSASIRARAELLRGDPTRH